MSGLDLDYEYFKKKLKLVIRDIKSYTPEELNTELLRLAETAKPITANKEE